MLSQVGVLVLLGDKQVKYYEKLSGFLNDGEIEELRNDFLRYIQEGRYSKYPSLEYQAKESIVSGSNSYDMRGSFNSLLEDKLSYCESVVGTELVPMYSYGRIYTKGCVLGSHIDNISCQHTFTVSLSNKIWPLFFNLNENDLAVDLEIGEALYFRGQILYHWRDALPHDNHAQIFLHYVEKETFERQRSELNRYRRGVPMSKLPLSTIEKMNFDPETVEVNWPNWVDVEELT